MAKTMENMIQLKSWNEKKQSAKDHFCVSFDALAENEGFARVCAASFYAKLDPTMEELDDVKTAVSEAVTNCIIHGYLSNKKGTIYMDGFISEGDFYIEIKDFGVGIKDIKKAMEPMYSSKADEERFGMGFSFMEAFMDELFVISGPMKGTSVYMKKLAKANNRGE